jgi:hypothetical protein
MNFSPWHKWPDEHKQLAVDMIADGLIRDLDWGDEEQLIHMSRLQLEGKDLEDQLIKEFG